MKEWMKVVDLLAHFLLEGLLKAGLGGWRLDEQEIINSGTLGHTMRVISLGFLLYKVEDTGVKMTIIIFP